MKIRTKNSEDSIKIILSTFILTILAYTTYLLSLIYIDSNKEYKLLIFILCWSGIFIFIYILISWYKISNSFFNPYTIFISFFFLFNFGQCLLWAFGIHIDTEIGKSIMYRNFGIAEDLDIIKAQILTLICILTFHFGAIICIKSKYINKNKDFISHKAIYYTSILLSIIVIPITVYNAIYDFRVASIYGYGALYYSEYTRNNAILSLISEMFFPCLVGLLIGSSYSKKVQKFVYSVFIFYMIIYLISGDRGSWIYRIFILIWLSNKCYKKINIKKLIKYFLLAILGIYITNIIVSIRGLGLKNLNLDIIYKSLNMSNSPIILSIFEMGSSMQPTIVLQKYGWDIWPYLNSYILAFIGCISNKFIYILNTPFELLSSWFSQKYLGISWGAGFSLIAEALLNTGPILAPIIMIIEGYIISSMIYIDNKFSYEERPIRIFFAATTLDKFINITRNELHPTLKNWFYGVVIFYIIILVARRILMSRFKSYNNNGGGKIE